MRARIEVDGKAFDVVLEPVEPRGAGDAGSAGGSAGPARFVATVEGERFEVRVDRRGPGAVVAAGNALHVVGPVDAQHGTAVVDGVARHVRVLEVHGAPGLPDGAAAAGGAVRPPMMGKVEAVHVQAGQQVAAGDLLFVLEAMKMRNEVRAPVAGRVAAVHVRAGVTVGTDLVAVQIEP